MNAHESSLPVLESEKVDLLLEQIQQNVQRKFPLEGTIEVVDYASDGYIIFGVFEFISHFQEIVSIIDDVMRKEKLSYSITFQTEQVDYRTDN